MRLLVAFAACGLLAGAQTPNGVPARFVVRFDCLLHISAPLDPTVVLALQRSGDVAAFGIDI